MQYEIQNNKKETQKVSKSHCGRQNKLQENKSKYKSQQLLTKCNAN